MVGLEIAETWVLSVLRVSLMPIRLYIMIYFGILRVCFLDLVCYCGCLLFGYFLCFGYLAWGLLIIIDIVGFVCVLFWYLCRLVRDGFVVGCISNCVAGGFVCVSCLCVCRLFVVVGWWWLGFLDLICCVFVVRLGFGFVGWFY